MQFSMWQLPSGAHENCEIVGFNPDGTLGGPWNIVGGTSTICAMYTVMIDRFYAERQRHTHRRHGGDRPHSRAHRRLHERYQNLHHDAAGFTSIRNASLPPGFRTTRRSSHRPDEAWHRHRCTHRPDQKRPEWCRRVVAAGVRGATNYWMFGPGAGIAVIAGGLLGLLVGVVIVAQTIYAATMDHLREFGTLKAIGASNWFVYRVIFTQAVISAVLGYAIAVIVALVLASQGQQGEAPTSCCHRRCG